MTASLVLHAVDVTGPAHWRWRLEENGIPRFDFEVQLEDSPWEFKAACDLYGYLRTADGDPATVLDAIGRWMRECLLGPGITDRISDESVLIKVDADAAFLLEVPLDLTHDAYGVRLGDGLTSFVYELSAALEAPIVPRRIVKSAIGEKLRILVLLSAPQPGSLVQMRRERYELVRNIEKVAAGKLVDLRVLQLGVTDDLLSATLDENDGWDILHLCTGAGDGGLWIEQDNGAPRQLTAAELISRLRPARRQLKLVVLSANRSAEESMSALRMIGLAEEADELAAELGRRPRADAAPHRTELIGALVRELDVAVFAMRYPVTDDFMIMFAQRMYRSLLRSGNPVNRAVATSRYSTVQEMTTQRYPLHAIAAPALYGSAAIDLFVKPRNGSGILDFDRERYSPFPAEPARLVGHVRTIAAANAAIAVGSGHSGVLLTGVAEVGKSTCALELFHQRKDQFKPRSWWNAPTGAEDDLKATRFSLLQSWSDHLGINVDGVDESDDKWDIFVRRVRAVLASESILLALDNFQTLLHADGTWRDPMLRRLMTELTEVPGPGRLLMAGRVAPAEPLPTVLVREVTPLTSSEAVLLTCELPSLGKLLHDLASPGVDGKNGDREVAREVIRAACGLACVLQSADGLVSFARFPLSDEVGGTWQAAAATIARAADAPGTPASEAVRALVTGLAGGRMWAEAAPALRAIMDGREPDLEALAGEAKRFVDTVVSSRAGGTPSSRRPPG
jgi:hypothetical protein